MCIISANGKDKFGVKAWPGIAAPLSKRFGKHCISTDKCCANNDSRKTEKKKKQQSKRGERKDVKEKIKGEGTSTHPRGRENQTKWGVILWKKKAGRREGDVGGRRLKRCVIAVRLKKVTLLMLQKCPRRANTKFNTPGRCH